MDSSSTRVVHCPTVSQTQLLVGLHSTSLNIKVYYRLAEPRAATWKCQETSSVRD